MADIYDKPRDTVVRETRYVEGPRESSGALWFIVGAVVVALGVLFAVLYSGDDRTVTPNDGGTSVTIETAPAPTPAPGAEVAPMAPPAEPEAAPAPVPVEPEAAPAPGGN